MRSLLGRGVRAALLLVTSLGLALGLATTTVYDHPAESSALESSPEPIAWNPTSRKTTPRNSSTITMARRGSPEESEWRSFIWPTVSAWCANPRKAQVTSKPRRRAALAFCLLARSRRSRLTSIGSAASASGRSTSAFSTW